MKLNLAEWIQIVGAIIALLTLWKSLLEYIRQGASKRAEQFLQMRSRLKENPDFARICDLLQANSPELKKISLIKKDSFIGFFEELDMLWNSNIFNDQVVYYMFGHFELKCWKNNYFWAGLDRKHPL